MSESSEDQQPADSNPPRKRRVRYRGTHPRRFEEKYKEHAPEQYPEAIEQVRSRGATPAGQHISIMVEEILEALRPVPGERGVDATLGWGGHSQQLLTRIRPGGQLLGLDADGIELPRTEARLRALGFGESEFFARRTNFASLQSSLLELGWEEGVDFVLADLGLSSMQIDNPARGFTFKQDGPLDMRLNPKRGESAAEYLQRVEESELVRILRDNGDEPRAERIAQALLAVEEPLLTTRALRERIESVLAPRVQPDDITLSIRRVFQAIRIEVNDEFGVLDRLLAQVPHCLRAGGRFAIMSFHSGEDRRVKKSLERGLAQGLYSRISSDVIRASRAERHANPRSAPAKLRWAQR